MSKCIHLGITPQTSTGQGETFQCVEKRKAIRCYCPSIPPDKLLPNMRREKNKVLLTNILFWKKKKVFFSDTGGKKKMIPKAICCCVELVVEFTKFTKTTTKKLAAVFTSSGEMLIKGTAAQFNSTVISTLPVLHAKGGWVKVLRCTAVYIGPAVAQLPPHWAPASACISPSESPCRINKSFLVPAGGS